MSNVFQINPAQDALQMKVLEICHEAGRRRTHDFYNGFIRRAWAEALYAGLSPIEYLMGVSLSAEIQRTNSGRVPTPLIKSDLAYTVTAEEVLQRVLPLRASLGQVSHAWHQVKVGNRFIVDFLVATELEGAVVAAAVECDGHEFHEKTKEQVSKDKERDRFLQANGVMVLRYSGADIWANTTACTDNVFEVLSRAMEARNT